MKNKFTTVTLLDGRKITILEPNSGHFVAANFWNETNQRQKEPKILDSSYFILRELLRIDGRHLTELELLTFSIDDYISISDALGASMKKITGL